MTEETDPTLRQTLEQEMNTLIEGNDETEEEEVEDAVPPIEDEEAQSESEEDSNESEGVEQSSEEKDVETETEEVTLEAPEHWAADDRELFGGQSEEVKGYLLKRHNEMESGFTKKSQELAEQRKTVDNLSQFMSKWEPHTSSLRDLATKLQLQALRQSLVTHMLFLQSFREFC